MFDMVVMDWAQTWRCRARATARAGATARARATVRAGAGTVGERGESPLRR